jgi:hypothetical protein
MHPVAPVSEPWPITEEANFLQIKNIDHIHFWVGNAKHAMYWWWKGMGFKVAMAALEFEKPGYMQSWIEGSPG